MGDFWSDWLAFPGLQKLEPLEATAVGHIMRESLQNESNTKASFCLHTAMEFRGSIGMHGMYKTPVSAVPF